jgi:hypothetical protein
MDSTRRTVLAALFSMGAVAVGASTRPLRAALADPLPLPTGPLRLERRLMRSLGERAAITVVRSWDVRFAAQGRGIMIAGTQIAATVDAPPNLAELARIEQQRDTSAMFPILLSDAGQIMTPPDAPAENADVTAAARVAEALIARQPRPEEARARSLHYLALLHRAGSGVFDMLPGDLFYPAGIPIERSETITLPDGMRGSFSLTYTARPQPGAPWLAEAQRRVITRIAGLERSAIEDWTLSAM